MMDKSSLSVICLE